MHFDLLLNPIRLVWAVNCQVEEDSIRIGALYLEPQIPDQIIRLSSGSDIFDIVLPEELLRSEQSFRAWNIELPLHTHDEQVRQPSLYS